jgi:hypothetical protein
VNLLAKQIIYKAPIDQSQLGDWQAEMALTGAGIDDHNDLFIGLLAGKRITAPLIIGVQV